MSPPPTTDVSGGVEAPHQARVRPLEEGTKAKSSTGPSLQASRVDRRQLQSCMGQGDGSIGMSRFLSGPLPTRSPESGDKD